MKKFKPQTRVRFGVINPESGKEVYWPEYSNFPFVWNKIYYDCDDPMLAFTTSWDKFPSVFYSDSELECQNILIKFIEFINIRRGF